MAHKQHLGVPEVVIPNPIVAVMVMLEALVVG